NFIAFPDLLPGDYTVTETAVAGWVLTDITCSDVADPDPTRRAGVNRETGTVVAHLAPGQRLDCTFTNTQIQPGTITINKLGIGGDDAFSFTATGNGVPSTFSITTGLADHIGSEQLSGLSPGSFTVTETVPGGWHLASPVSCVVTQGANTSVTPLQDGV